MSWQQLKIAVFSTQLITKNNSNWIKVLSVRPKIIKLLEKNVEKKPLDLGLDNDFLGYGTEAEATKVKIK